MNTDTESKVEVLVWNYQTGEWMVATEFETVKEATAHVESLKREDRKRYEVNHYRILTTHSVYAGS